MNKTSDLVNLVLCICAKDGVITQMEEETTFELIHALTSKSNDLKVLSESGFEKIIDNFFASDKQLEDYLNEFNDNELLNACLSIAKDSASSDGFDIRENIAYKKALDISGVKDEDF